MKIFGIVAKALFAVCLPFFLLTVSTAAIANTVWLNDYAAVKYGVPQELAANGLPLSNSQIDSVYTQLRDYYNSGEELITITVPQGGKTISLFTEEETLHFKDVKNLIRTDEAAAIGTGIYILIFTLICFIRNNRRDLALAVTAGAALTLGALLFLGLGSLVNFDALFLRFHELFFTNTFWSAQGYMILLYPEQYFIYALWIIIGITVAGAFVPGLFALAHLNRIRKSKQGV